MWMGVCLSVCPYICQYVHMYICMFIGTFLYPSLCSYVHQDINTYLKAIASLLPYHFAQVLTLTDWVPWLTGVVVALLQVGYLDAQTCQMMCLRWLLNMVNVCLVLTSPRLESFNFVAVRMPCMCTVSCHVRECWSICTILFELSRGLVSCIILFIECTVIHNCSSLGSLVFAHLGDIQEG